MYVYVNMRLCVGKQKKTPATLLTLFYWRVKTSEFSTWVKKHYNVSDDIFHQNFKSYCRKTLDVTVLCTPPPKATPIKTCLLLKKLGASCMILHKNIICMTKQSVIQE